MPPSSIPLFRVQDVPPRAALGVRLAKEFGAGGPLPLPGPPGGKGVRVRACALLRELGGVWYFVWVGGEGGLRESERGSGVPQPPNRKLLTPLTLG